ENPDDGVVCCVRQEFSDRLRMVLVGRLLDARSGRPRQLGNVAPHQRHVALREPHLPGCARHDAQSIPPSPWPPPSDTFGLRGSTGCPVSSDFHRAACASTFSGAVPPYERRARTELSTLSTLWMRL